MSQIEIQIDQNDNDELYHIDKKKPVNWQQISNHIQKIHQADEQNAIYYHNKYDKYDVILNCFMMMYKLQAPVWIMYWTIIIHYQENNPFINEQQITNFKYLKTAYFLFFPIQLCYMFLNDGIDYLVATWFYDRCLKYNIMIDFNGKSLLKKTQFWAIIINMVLLMIEIWSFWSNLAILILFQNELTKLEIQLISVNSFFTVDDNQKIKLTQQIINMEPNERKKIIKDDVELRQQFKSQQAKLIEQMQIIPEDQFRQSLRGFLNLQDHIDNANNSSNQQVKADVKDFLNQFCFSYLNTSRINGKNIKYLSIFDMYIMIILFPLIIFLTIFKSFSKYIQIFHLAIFPMDLHDWTFTDSLQLKFKNKQDLQTANIFKKTYYIGTFANIIMLLYGVYTIFLQK